MSPEGLYEIDHNPLLDTREGGGGEGRGGRREGGAQNGGEIRRRGEGCGGPTPGGGVQSDRPSSEAD